MAGAAALIERSRRVRRTVRGLARLVNPAVLLVAGRGWMPVLGVVRHRGRRTGRVYATPLGMRPLGDGVVIPRTFGPGAGWYRNLQAAGSAAVSYRGRTRDLGRPRRALGEEIRTAFPRYERALFKLIGIDDFVVLESP